MESDLTGMEKVMSEDAKSSVKIGDLVRLRVGHDTTGALYSVGVVVKLEAGKNGQAKIAFLNPPFYEEAYHDPNDDWFYTKNLEVLSEGR
jgi:hypothetical protein